MSSEFDRAIALSPTDAPGRFTGSVSEDFWVQSGPNGGYLTAIALHAATRTLADPARPARSIHARFLSAPKAGPFEAEVTLLRAGRSMTSLAVNMRQGERIFLAGSACFAGAFSPIHFQDRAMPAARPIADSEAITKAIPLNHRYDMWRAIGGELRQSERAHTGGWIRFADPRPIDAYAAAALWDAWPPAVFARAMEQRFRGAVPTAEVSVFFRQRLPLEHASPQDHVLLNVHTSTASEGFIEEDGELWSADGTLLAQSRQLALLL